MMGLITVGEGKPTNLDQSLPLDPLVILQQFYDELGAQTLRAGIPELLRRLQHHEVSQCC